MNANEKSKGEYLNELRRSSASGTMGDRRTKRNRDKSTIKRKAIEDGSDESKRQRDRSTRERKAREDQE